MSTYRFLKVLALSLAFAGLFMGSPPQAKAGLIGPSPYLAFDNSLPGAGSAISPFAGMSFSYFYLETFEDHLLNTPGVSFTAPPFSGVTSVVFGPNLHDSVDADDGAIDGSGLLGDSFFSTPGATGIMFHFSAAVLGSLPTHAGIVWTDSLGEITFQAFGPGGSLLGTIGPISQAGVFPDESFNGETAEDRFFGVTNPGGISAIFISNSIGGIEVDHLQYGLAAQQEVVVPEPSSLALFGLSVLSILGFTCRRKRADSNEATAEPEVAADGAALRVFAA